jgi:uncharacterized protein YbjT (DUF2867 family)
MILITGGTGSNGAELTRLLSAQGVPMRVMVGNAAKAGSIAGLKGVDLIHGDFDDVAYRSRPLKRTGYVVRCEARDRS